MAWDNFLDTLQTIGHTMFPIATAYDIGKTIFTGDRDTGNPLVGALAGLADVVGGVSDDLLNLSSNADTALQGSDVENLDDASLADYLTGLFTSVGDEAEAARKYNAAEAEKSRQWQERMSNTQYQRAVADMRKAGLNPILAVSKGMSAGTPAGATASTSPAGGDSLADILSILGGTISDILKVIAK